MKLVDDRLGVGTLERSIPFPVVDRGIGDDAFHGDRGVAAASTGGAAIVVVRYGDRQTVRIEEHLLPVEPTAALRLERSVSPVRVDLTDGETGHEDVPVVIGAMRARIERDHATGLGRLLAVEQQQFDRRGSFRKHTEVDALRIDGGTEGGARAALDGEFHRGWRDSAGAPN